MSSSPSIAAFFDLDGTLLPPPSLEWRFISYLLWHDHLGTINILRWLARAGLSLQRGPRQAFEANKQYVAGLAESLVEDWTKSFGAGESNPSALIFFGEGLNCVRWHQSQNHRVFLVSGTLAPLANYAAKHLPGTVQVIATELAACAVAAESEEVNVGRKNLHPPIWTGQVSGEHMVGLAKSRALQRMAARHELDLARCYAYGNSWADRAMLETVGFPAAVNPSNALARLAKKRGWPVSRWSGTKPTHGRVSSKLDFGGFLRKTRAVGKSHS